MKVKIIGEQSVKNMPWQDRPQTCKDVVWRYSQNPVIDRNPIPCASGIYNSAVVPYNGEFIGIFRTDYKSYQPFLHFGRSKDGIHWDINHDRIEFVDELGKKCPPMTYAYDPRLVKIEDTYYITWCNCFHGPTIGVAKTKDFKTFVQLENAFLPFNRNGVLFPRKLNGKFAMLSRPSDNGHTPFGDIFLSESPDMVHWGRHRHVMGSGLQWWQGRKIGAGPIPIETSEGWLMIYHGVLDTCNGLVYSMGAALLDINDPSKVLYRTNQYLLTPEAPYETIGKVANVAFPCAAICDADTGRLAVYYGAADTYTALAFCYVDELVEFVKNNSTV